MVIRKLFICGLIGSALGLLFYLVSPIKYSNKVSIKIGGFDGKAIQPPNVLLEDLKQKSFQERLFLETKLPEEKFVAFSQALRGATISGSGAYLNIALNSKDPQEIEEILNSVAFILCKNLNSKIEFMIKENQKKIELQNDVLKEMEKIISKGGLSPNDLAMLQRDVYGIKNALLTNNLQENSPSLWMTEITTSPQITPQITTPSLLDLVVRGLVMGLFIGFILIFI